MKKRSLFKTLIRIAAGIGILGTALRAPPVRAGDPLDGGTLISVERFFPGDPKTTCRRMLLRATRKELRLGALALRSSRSLRNHLAIPSRVALNDQFALEIMVKRKVISEDALRFYRGETGKIHPEQISNVETVDLIQETANQATTHGKDISGYLTHIIKKTGDARYTWLRRKATLRLIAGQTFRSIRGRKVHSLPWMIEFPKAAKGFDRKKYKFVWEFGRAAQNEAGLTDTGRAVAAILALRELQAAGGDLGDAYIFVHAPLKKNADLYRRWGYEHFSYPNPGAEDEILMIPLAKIINDPETWKVSASVQEIQALLGPGIDPLSILRYVDETTADRITDVRLTFGSPPKHANLTLYDHTQFSEELVKTQLERHLPGALATSPNDPSRVLKALHKKFREVTELHQETATNFEQQHKGLRATNEEMPELQIDGLQQLAKGSENDFGIGLLGILRTYREKLEALGATDVPGRMRELFLTARGENMAGVKKHLRSLGVTFESHVVQMEKSTTETIAIEVAPLLELEAENIDLSRRIRLRIENRVSERIYSAPLNF